MLDPPDRGFFPLHFIVPRTVFCPKCRGLEKSLGTWLNGWKLDGWTFGWMGKWCLNEEISHLTDG